MSILNTVLGSIFNLLLWPFRGFSPMVGLTVVSVLCGIGMLYAFKYTSNQDRIAEVKRQIHAGIFEIRLFNDDLRAIFRAQLDILRHNFTYLRLSLVPVAWMIVPVAIIVIQLQFHYGYEGLRPGDAALLKVHLSGDASATSPAVAGTIAASNQQPATVAGPDLALEAPPGLRVDSPVLWIPSLGEADWRLVAEEPGDYVVTVRVGDSSATKRVQVTEAVMPLSPVRPSSGLLDQLVYPVEAPLGSANLISSIELTYRDREVNFLGLHMHWIIAFLILTVVVAFALRKPLGVTF